MTHKYKHYLTTALALAVRSVFETGKAGWKLDENGAIVLLSGNPVWVDESGQEGSVGADTVGRLSAENKAFRLRAEKAEKALQPFEGLDATAAKAAIETVTALGEGGLVDAAKLEAVKTQIVQQYEGQLAEANEKLGVVTNRLNDTVLSAAFTGSKFINESIAIPADLFQASFGKNFKVEEGRIIPLDAKGEPLMSKTRFGETADFEEGIAILVDGYANKDRILKAPQGGGTGSGGAGGGRGASSVVRRADLAAMSPPDQAATAAKARAGEVQIVD